MRSIWFWEKALDRCRSRNSG